MIWVMGFSMHDRNPQSTILKFHNNAIAERYRGLGGKSTLRKQEVKGFVLFF